MPRPTNSAFKSEKNKSANQPIHLYVIHDYDGNGNNFNVAEYPSAVTYGGVVYNPFPVTFDSIKENDQGEIDTVNLTMGNVSRYLQAYLEAMDFRGKKVTIRTVWANKLTDAAAFTDDIYYIDSYSSDVDDVAITLSSKLDVLQIQLPARTVSRNDCQWTWKSTECGYSGAGDYCKRKKAGCKALGNYSRFGAFPSVQKRRVVAV